jgi:hypothetical protein
LDIDRHEGKQDGVQSLYRWLESIGLDRQDLPLYLQNIEGGSFPLYTQTKTGLHLFFNWTGATMNTPKRWHLCDEVEVTTETIREGYNGSGKLRILHYNNDSPPMVGLILDKILEKQAEKVAHTPIITTPQVKTHYTRPRFQEFEQRPSLTLDTLAAELPAGLGHHDAQVHFAGKCARLYHSYTQKGSNKAADFDFSAALAYVRSRPDLFGTGTDTANTVKSFYKGK